MDRRYYRKYENFDTVVPRVEDFPVLNADNQIAAFEEENKIQPANAHSLNTDDLVLLVVLVILLMEEEKDLTAILGVAALLFSGYII